MADETHHVDEILNKLADAKKNVDRELNKLWNEFHKQAEEIRNALNLLENEKTATPTNAQSARSLINKEISRLQKYAKLRSREAFAPLTRIAEQLITELNNFMPVLENYNKQNAMVLANKLDVLVATVETNYLHEIQNLKNKELKFA